MTALRLIFISQAVAVALFIVAFWFIANEGYEFPAAWWIIGIYALFLHAILIPFGRRMMTRSDDEAGLVSRYRTRAFIGIGESVAAELIAIVLTFWGAPFLIIPAAAAVAEWGGGASRLRNGSSDAATKDSNEKGRSSA